MKTLFTSLLFISLLFISSNAHSQNELRIMSYNIRNGAGMDTKTDYDRTADVITQAKPHVVAVQEIDSVTNRSKQKFVLQEIAQRIGMHYTYAPAIDHDGGKYGIGILSKEKPILSYHLPLPGREEKRALLIAEFEEYVFICVHLSLTDKDQVKSISIINKENKKFKKPILIAGDFNAEPESKTIKNLQKKFNVLTELGAKTYPANSPTESIDYIAIDKKSLNKYELDDTFVIADSESSDHRPIIADIKFR